MEGKGDEEKECTVRTAKYGKLQESAVKTGHKICREKARGGTGLSKWRKVTPFSPPLRVLYSIFYLLSIEICEGMGFSNNRKPKAHPCNPRMEHPLAPPATASIPEAVALAFERWKS